MTDTSAPAAQRWRAPTASNPVHAKVALPGSKSMMARALVLTAAGVTASSLTAPLRARDTSLMVAALRAMGTHIDTEDDAVWQVQPGALRGPTQIDCGLAGTVMRFLPPLAATATGAIAFDGDPHARTRPMAPLLDALEQLGANIDRSAEGGLPFTITGMGRLAGGEVTMNAALSSQFISGLLLSGPLFDQGLTVRHDGPPVPSAPHVRMTVDMLRAAGAVVDDSQRDTWRVEPGRLSGRTWNIEPDLSNAAPFMAAALITDGSTTIPGWPQETSQPGDLLRDVLVEFGGRVELSDAGMTARGDGRIRGIDIDLSEAGELTPVIAAIAALAETPSTLRGIGHLRGHETDRLAALTTEINGLGGDVTATEDVLRIRPRKLRGGVFNTYDDHRMAQAAAVIGLAVPEVELSDVACTSKTLPDFPHMWDQLLGTGS